MRITRFRLHNFKSVRDLPELGFGAGFNIIVGPNNAGKTALLTALSLSFGNEPHRSPETVPRPGSPPEPTSSAEVSVEIPRVEFIQMLADYGSPVYVSHPADGTPVQAVAQKFLADLPETVILRMTWTGGGQLTGARLATDVGPETSAHAFLMHVPRGTSELTLANDALHPGIGPHARLPFTLGTLARVRIYCSEPRG
jgi:AAA domain